LKLTFRATILTEVYLWSSSALAINSGTMQPMRPCLNLPACSSLHYWVNSTHQSQLDYKLTWNVILYIKNLQADFYQQGREKFVPQYDKASVVARTM